MLPKQREAYEIKQHTVTVCLHIPGFHQSTQLIMQSTLPSTIRLMIKDRKKGTV